MFAESLFDTPDQVWTTRGLLPRGSLLYREEHQQGQDHVIHARQWESSGEVVRRDVWVEVLSPLLGVLSENQGAANHG